MKRITYPILAGPKPTRLRDGTRAQVFLYDAQTHQGIVLPIVEYTITPGDRVTIYVNHEPRVLWWRINDGPLLKSTQRELSLQDPATLASLAKGVPA